MHMTIDASINKSENMQVFKPPQTFSNLQLKRGRVDGAPSEFDEGLRLQTQWAGGENDTKCLSTG